MAEIKTQLAIFLKNVPGTLHAVLEALHEAKINIEGIMVNDAVDHAVVRMVVDAPNRVLHLLGDRGLLVVENDLVVHEMPNEPGQLLALAKILSKAKVNISYIYGSAPREGGIPRIFLHTDDNRKVMKILNAGGKQSGRKKK